MKPQLKVNPAQEVSRLRQAADPEPQVPVDKASQV
jgi:hypothetical protein